MQKIGFAQQMDGWELITRASAAYRRAAGKQSIGPLISSLQTLAGPACHPYLVEILVDSHSQLQKEILGLLSRSNDLTVFNAVSRLAESTPHPAVKELAEKYLAATRPA